MPEPVFELPPAPSRRPRLTLVAPIAVAAAVAAVVFAVSGGTSKLDPVAQAATTSANAPGFQMHFAMEMTSSALPTALTATGNGSFDPRDRTGSMSFAMNFGNDPRVAQALGSSTVSMQEILRGATVYMKLPAAVMNALPTSGKQWIAVDLAKVTGIPGLSSLSNPVSSDPSQMLQYLRAASDSIVAEGHQRVDGLETTHYHADLSLSRVADALPSAYRSAAQQALSILQQSLKVHDIPVDVWIDAKHLVRRIQMTFSANLPSSQTLHEGMTIDISHYGPQPQPALPPAGQVTSLGGLTGLGG
jgi:hypothetical protein